MKLKPHRIKRYKEIAALIYKYARTDMLAQFDAQDFLEKEDLPKRKGSQPDPEELPDDLERMGPTFVKLGQLFSSRADLLPEPYLKALSRLQDKVKPFSYAEVEHILSAELGVRISKAFSHFHPEPLASASLGQVHLAALRDGRPVVVKVQRPHICKQIAEDFEILDEIATFLDRHTRLGRQYRFCRVVAELRHTLAHELDYQREAANLRLLAENMRHFEHIRVPLPVLDYTTHNVLTMEYIRGTKITTLSPIVRVEINGQKLADELLEAYLNQVLVDGLFHADPHPGNIFLTPEGQIALLDLGMVGHLTPAMQESLLKLLLAITEGESERAADIAIQLSETSDDFKESQFRRDIALAVAEQHESSLLQMRLGKTLLDVVRNAARNGLFVPSELTMLGKTLLQLDEVGRVLAPNFNPNAAVRRHAAEIMNQRFWKNVTPSKLFNSLLEVKEFVGGIPTRLNRILDAIADAEFQVKVQAVDVQSFLEGFQKIANRITAGLVLAALIIGAALLMNVETAFVLFGYPGLAMLCFMAAAGGGFWLVFSILIQDHRDRRQPPR